jgi:hypoxanthine phosphoribosyltransferase
MGQPSIRKIAFSEEDLKKRIGELGEQIAKDYAGMELVLIGVLKGSMFFLCDLSRAIDLPIQIDVISIGIYPNSTGRTGAVRITKDLDFDIAGKHVLVIEDIIRSGLTTGYLMQNLEAKGAASIKICTLLLSPEEQLINIPVAYVGFEVNKIRLLGYGLDVDEKGRNLPYIAEITQAGT